MVNGGVRNNFQLLAYIPKMVHVQERLGLAAGLMARLLSGFELLRQMRRASKH